MAIQAFKQGEVDFHSSFPGIWIEMETKSGMDNSGKAPSVEPLRLAILQRVVNPYRRGLFREISRRDGIQLQVFHGEDVPNSKVRNAKSISGFEATKLPTRFFKLGKLHLAWHQNLYETLKNFNPEVILCEGESNLLSYLVALRYRLSMPRTGLALWSLVWLIGRPLRSNPFAYFYRRIVHRWFDAYVAYSSFSKATWVKLGMNPDRVVIATNVADTTNHIRLADEEAVSTVEAQRRLGIPNGFTVLYSGTLDRVKKPEVLLEVAKEFRGENVNFVFLGRGPLLDEIRQATEALDLTRVFVPGFVDPDQVSLYYFAGDVLAVPGRGGMVISEAMAYGLPVLVHQADGTEVDLVENGVTGFRLENGSPQEFKQRIRELSLDSELRTRMGKEGRARVRKRFTTVVTADCILEAVQLAKKARCGKS